MIFNIMQEIITHHFGNMNKEFGKVSNFMKMLDIPERGGSDARLDFSRGVRAERVSFTYPGREAPAVDDVSLVIAGGETIAIVGENGAGKSTLVRLLTGIYRPSEGAVTVGGAVTAEASAVSVFGGISGVFQKYQRYKMTLADNVTISDTLNTGADSATSGARIETSLREAGMKAAESGIDASLRKAGMKAAESEIETSLREAGTESSGAEIALDTMLSPEFDGVDLSGGQWQRVAIARGLYRANGFIVLDEPTAAIDPIEESILYSQFQKLAEGKCAVIVTHRLGSAKLAHRIIVMDAGKIIDAGTHDELLSRPGKYADMWAAQAQWYERAEPAPPAAELS
jgi:ATP-binding cassette subfamily B protein